MKSKEKKLPVIFRKPVKREVWEKKYIGRIFLPEDKAFLESLLIENGDEVSISSEGLSGRNLKRLKGLGTVIKANRKGVSIILLVVLTVLALGAIGWQFFLKDVAVKRLIESRMEQVFLAEVKVGSVDLSLLRGVLQINNMTIADARNPMMNLVEFDSIKGEIDVSRLLKGKIRIEELGFTGMKRGTERTVSGAVPGSMAETVGNIQPENAAADPGTPNLISETAGAISTLIGEINIEEIMEQQKKNLKSFTVIENSTAKIEQWTEEWGALAGEWEGRASEWESTAVYITGINPDSFSSISSAQTTITQLQSMYDRAGSDYAEIVRIVDDSKLKINETSMMLSDIQEAVGQDIEYVESLVSLPEEGQADWAASIIEQQLGVPVLRYLDYFKMGTDFYQRFQSVLLARKGQNAQPRRLGRSLVFEIAGEPVFLLEHAYASGEEEAFSYKADLYNLTDRNEPADDGPRLALGWDTGGSGMGTAEIGRQGGTLSLSDMPFDLGGSLISLGIANLSGSLSLESEVELLDENVSGIINLSADGIMLTEAASDEFLFRIIRKSIEAVIPLSVAGLFSWDEAGGLELSAETELDKQLGNAVSAILEESAGEGVKYIKEFLESELAVPLQDVKAATAMLSEYIESVKSYEDEIASYRTMAEEKIAEIETAAAAEVEAEIRRQLEVQLGEETTEQIENTVDEVKKGLGGLLGF
ncbi:MAG: hypothetical protein JEZ04_21130 [Spirochaetales bacterium]|nr:hypothetical protein [Spirochaetales bacterium]